MAKDLLDFVNEVLKKTDVLDSDVGVLASLSDSGRQTLIDTAIQSINEVVDDLYEISGASKPKQMREATITLATGVQDYALHSALTMLRTEYGLIDETNNHIIDILDESGYRSIVHNDLDQDDTGLPHFCAISPITGRLVFDRTPTATENGRVYKYRYDKDLELTSADDAVPFTNIVFRALVEAAAERYKFHRHQEFSDGAYNRGMARAAKYLRRLPARTTYGKQRPVMNATDPMNDNASTR